MYNILALDQSSRTSGYAIFRDGQLYSHGTFTITDDNIGIRLWKIRSKVLELIEDFDIDEVVLEDIYMDGQKINNVQTFKVLAEVFGVLYELCVELKIPVEAVLAGTWKSTLNIKGKTRPEQKKNAQIWVEKEYGIKPIQDVVDAICIGAHISRQSLNDWGE